MITLQRPDPKISAFLGSNKGVKQGDAVHPSQFVVVFALGDRKVVWNALTGQAIETKYLPWFESRGERPLDENDVEMMALVKRDFLVSTKVDETGRYARMLAVIRAMEKPKSGYTGYTILPTTACNARCVYCYEEGLAHETMTDETVEQTIRYIHATRREGVPVSFHWFGGEPLVGEKVIDRICAAMREADVKYSSNMISNGSLMTEAMARKAKEDWHLTSVQITLDGREEMYCARKRYVNFPGSPYQAVLAAIHALLAQEIRVSIRLNVDEGNMDEMMALVDELEEELKAESRVSVYCHSIFAEEGDEPRDNDAFYAEMKKLNERLHRFNQNRAKNAKKGEEISQEPVDDANIQWESDEERCPEEESKALQEATEDCKTDDEEKKERIYDRRSYTRRHFCMVDSPMAGGVILPNGDICLCEHIGEVPIVGTIFDEAPFERETFIDRGREKDEKCAACALLPICTDFTSCPTCDRDCVKERLEMEKRSLRALEKEKRLPPITIEADGKIVRVNEPTVEFAEKCTPILADDYLKAEETVDMQDAETVLSN